MIAAANVKNLLNSDLSEFLWNSLRWNSLWLDNNIQEVRAALQGKRAPYINHTRSRIYTTYDEQVAALRQRCDEMESLMLNVVTMSTKYMVDMSRENVSYVMFVR